MVAGRKPPILAEAKLNAIFYACQQVAISIFEGVAVRCKKDELWATATQLLDDKIYASTLAFEFCIQHM